MAHIETWNGHISELEVDPTVVPAIRSLWMSTGVAGAMQAREMNATSISIQAFSQALQEATAMSSGAGS